VPSPKITPALPKASAERRIVPRLPGLVGRCRGRLQRTQAGAGVAGGGGGGAADGAEGEGPGGEAGGQGQCEIAVVLRALDERGAGRHDAVAVVQRNLEGLRAEVELERRMAVGT